MKNLRTISMLLACFAALILLTACTEPPDPHYLVDEGTRAYFNYQVGSYWVMKDSATGGMDSLYVDYYNVANNSQSTNEYIDMRILRNAIGTNIWLDL